MSRNAHCAAGDCPIIVERGMLMCKPHWFSLPKGLRDAVWRGWRAFNASRGLAPRVRLARMAAYREAVRAAQDYLAQAPLSPASVFRTEARQGGETVRYGQGRLL